HPVAGFRRDSQALAGRPESAALPSAGRAQALHRKPPRRSLQLMSPRQPTPRQLEELFQDLEDGSISAEDHAWLMALLREDPEIRESYLKHMAMVTGLHDFAAATAPEAE